MHEEKDSDTAILPQRRPLGEKSMPHVGDCRDGGSEVHLALTQHWLAAASAHVKGPSAAAAALMHMLPPQSLLQAADNATSLQQCEKALAPRLRPAAAGKRKEECKVEGTLKRQARPAGPHKAESTGVGALVAAAAAMAAAERLTEDAQRKEKTLGSEKPVVFTSECIFLCHPSLSIIPVPYLPALPRSLSP